LQVIDDNNNKEDKLSPFLLELQKWLIPTSTEISGLLEIFHSEFYKETLKEKPRTCPQL
jgi:hypothetical protein